VAEQGRWPWLVVVITRIPGESGRLADEIADRAYTAQSFAERSPENAVQALWLERRHRELRQGGSSGLWAGAPAGRRHERAGCCSGRGAGVCFGGS
jgi:hypothetical protein